MKKESVSKAPARQTEANEHVESVCTWGTSQALMRSFILVWWETDKNKTSCCAVCLPNERFSLKDFGVEIMVVCGSGNSQERWTPNSYSQTKRCLHSLTPIVSSTIFYQTCVLRLHRRVKLCRRITRARSLLLGSDFPRGDVSRNRTHADASQR